MTESGMTEWGVTESGMTKSGVTGSGSPNPRNSVLGGGVMRADDYAAFLATEYLAAYVPSGGGSVKVAVIGDADVADRFARLLSSVADDHDCLFASVRPRRSRRT